MTTTEPTTSETRADDLRLLDASEIRARRRPFAFVLYCLWYFVAGAVVAAPVSIWANAVWGSHPDGDAVLFRPGARELLVWLSGNGPALPIAARTTLLLAGGMLLLHQLPLAMTFAALSSGHGSIGTAPRTRTMLRSATSMLASFTLLFAIVSAAELVTIGAGVALASWIGPSLVSSVGEVPALALRVGITLPFLFAASVLGVEGDVARAHVARNAIEAPARSTWALTKSSLRFAVTIGKRAFAGAYIGWAWRAAAGCGFVVLGEVVSSALGGKGGSSLTLLFVAHQLVVVGRTALRMSWFARTSRTAAMSAAASTNV